MEKPIFFTKQQLSKKNYLEIKEIFDHFFKDKNINILDETVICILTLNKKIISFLCILSLSDFNSNNSYCENIKKQGVSINDSYIYNVCVHKDYCRKGYGKKILEYSHDYIKNNKKDNILLFVDNGNIPAICLYNKYNYKVLMATPSGFVMKKILDSDKRFLSCDI